ncbi:MAG TPA: adenylate/guanylate cyclase domain-containing protein [Caldimonas sp.]|jgi:class 3 adenylate cyclase/tetratricopeptide (TPR) repeat protein|nr:adenylate/guanylate cyclase domain-containing protein [Caldimonas sp.]HEX4234135.1 adenylate/guanylate cyclase domain-containing protein [Caldimonas sp.]
MRCARCQADNPAGARFCSACGGALAEACRQCGATLAEGQRFCSACGTEAAERAASPDDGERRHATVMFSDLSGYTALNEALDPEVVEAVMARIKADATACVERLGGTVNQFVGDEIMALFGVPLARRHDARSAVNAALELHRAVDEFVQTLPEGPARSLRMHTGINAGLVVVRRSDARAGDYALTGDAVNTAARLRGLAAPGEIVVSESTWRQVADAFDGEVGAAIEVKGKEQPLAAVRIRGPRAAPAAGGAPLVGRGEELREIRAVAEACFERKRSRVVVVRGDPGVGKSRLVAEFGSVAASLGFSCHFAAVLDFGSETGRDAVRSVARSVLGVAAAADDEMRRKAIACAVAERALAAEQRLFLHDLLDVAPPSDLRALAAAMNTAARERGSIDALCELIANAAAAAPLLVVVEDIHWADAWTLERLAALAVDATRQPLLLVMTTRFAGDPTAGAWRTQLHGAPLLGIDLAPLDREDALHLAELASSIAPKLVESCVERAEGNPLFLLQLLLDLGEATQASLPGSIQALVHTRMDRLAGHDKAALQAAAVLGQRFAVDALRHLVEAPAYDCRVLVEQFLVRADGSEFMFCHALIRDGAYASLLHARRRRLHARAGEWFAARELALAAEHFDRADDARAAPAYLSAGDALAAQFRFPAALALVERGIALATEQATRFALLMKRARLLVELGRAGEAIEACRTALATASSEGERASAMIATASAMRLNDRIAEGLAMLDDAEPLARAAGLELDLAGLHHLRGNLYFPLGREFECLRSHERSLEHARAAGSLEAEAAALGGIGDGYYLKGLMRSANQQFRASVKLAREHGLGRLEVANLPMIGWTDLHLAKIDEAVAVGREAIALAQTASQPRAEIMGRMLVHWVDGLVRNRLDEAERDSAACMELIASVGAKRFEAQLLAVMALIALRRGDRSTARARAKSALPICQQHGMGHIGPWLHGVFALIETDPAARRRWLDDGDRLLGLGCVSHNQVQLPELAIDALLEIGDWDGVERQCNHIRRYTAAEPLALCDFIVARGTALADFGRGERGDALRTTLVELQKRGVSAELNSLLPAIDSALERLAAAAAAP